MEFNGFANFKISETRSLIKRWEDYKTNKPSDATKRHFYFSNDNEEWVLLDNVISDLIFAWRHFREGTADEMEQLLCHEIMLYLIETGGKKRKGSRLSRNLRIQMAMDDGCEQHEACKSVVKLDGGKLDSVKRDFQKWKTQTNEEKELDQKNYEKSHQTKFHEVIDWE